MYTEHCKLLTAHCKLHSAQFTLKTTQCTLHCTLQVIILDRATLDGVATSKELLLRVLEWFAWILCDLLFQAFWPD